MNRQDAKEDFLMKRHMQQVMDAIESRAINLL